MISELLFLISKILIMRLTGCLFVDSVSDFYISDIIIINYDIRINNYDIRNIEI